MVCAPLRIGFIGNGGVAHSVRETLNGRLDGHEVVAILGRAAPDRDDGGVPVVADVAALLALRPNIVVECASHGAVQAHGEAILRAGVSLLLISIGALADRPLHDRLVAASRDGGGQLILASGAMAGIDALSAARLGGLAWVRYVGSKPPLAWRGTPAEQIVDLDALDAPHVFFRGSARDAALAYPKNSNVCATIALAGLGFDRTEVELVADPGTAKNVHRLSFEGADGRFDISIVGEPSPTNPKTSALTAHSIARLLDGMVAPIVI